MKYVGYTVLIVVGLSVSTLGLMLVLNFRDLATRLVAYGRTHSPSSRGFSTLPGGFALILIGLLIVVLTFAKIVQGR
ncbi:hypothetical protein [Nocardia sp. NBC_01327]|uniref:hypothetical protein n=1 Tax=Nocardia sp. NBC_01327 TaxID=2903593 RepID=UPI002E117E78|nr:hypothetical protein OG326_15940 [Nocardia sp. NBC_01327]